MELRHIEDDGVRTTIALRPLVWMCIDEMADDWRMWVEEQLSRKPANIGRAPWLRRQVIEQTRPEWAA